MTPMRKIEKDEWFQKNLRAVEAQKVLETRGDVVNEKSVYFKKIRANSDEAKTIDPIFLKAYGVDYNAERSLDIQISGPKQERLDHQFITYFEERPNTPEDKLKDNTDDDEEQSDNEDKKKKL